KCKNFSEINAQFLITIKFTKLNVVKLSKSVPNPDIKCNTNPPSNDPGDKFAVLAM
ncbi:unnamed protein product, partial [Hymenolepis diminuta]